MMIGKLIAIGKRGLFRPFPAAWKRFVFGNGRQEKICLGYCVCPCSESLINELELSIA